MQRLVPCSPTLRVGPGICICMNCIFEFPIWLSACCMGLARTEEITMCDRTQHRYFQHGYKHVFHECTNAGSESLKSYKIIPGDFSSWLIHTLPQDSHIVLGRVPDVKLPKRSFYDTVSWWVMDATLKRNEKKILWPSNFAHRPKHLHAVTTTVGFSHCTIPWFIWLLQIATQT